MRREFLIMAMLFTAFQLFAQKNDPTAKEFNEFLNRFPKIEWKDLDSLGKKEWEDLNHSDTIWRIGQFAGCKQVCVVQ